MRSPASVQPEHHLPPILQSSQDHELKGSLDVILRMSRKIDLRCTVGLSSGCGGVRAQCEARLEMGWIGRVLEAACDFFTMMTPFLNILTPKFSHLTSGLPILPSTSADESRLMLPSRGTIVRLEVSVKQNDTRSCDRKELEPCGHWRQEIRTIRGPKSAHSRALRCFKNGNGAKGTQDPRSVNVCFLLYLGYLQ